jgi:biopolymer transport protein ExbD
VRLKHGRTFDGEVASFGCVVEAEKRKRHLTMKLSRTTNYNFGWLLLIGLVDLAFLLAFFLLLSSNFILQQGISISMPFSRFSLGPQSNQQIISITGGAVPAIYFQDQRVTMEQLGPLLDAAKRKDQSIIIKADRSASYETVAVVTNAALEHGISSVALAATPPR